jgi:quercetin dioxygenase-like cupin family protein
MGDYIWFDAGVAHVWEALEDSVSVVIRWPSIPGDQK